MTPPLKGGVSFLRQGHRAVTVFDVLLRKKNHVPISINAKTLHHHHHPRTLTIVARHFQTQQQQKQKQQSTQLFTVRFFSSRYNASGNLPSKDSGGGGISAHLFFFTLFMIPAVAYFAYAERYGPSSDEVQEELSERYGPQIREASQRNQAMHDWFLHTVKQPDGTFDDKLNRMLHAGKQEKKRLHAVDSNYYGTAQGVQAREQAQQETATAVKMKKGRKKKRNEKSDPHAKEEELLTKKKKSARDHVTPTTLAVAGVAVVAAAAAAVTVVGGGARKA